MSCKQSSSGRKCNPSIFTKCTSTASSTSKKCYTHHHQHYSSCDNFNHLIISASGSSGSSGSSEIRVDYACDSEINIKGNLFRLDENGDFDVGPTGGILFYVESATGPTGPYIDRIPLYIGETFRIWSTGGLKPDVKQGSALFQLTMNNIIVGPPFPDVLPDYPVILVDKETSAVEVKCPDNLLSVSGATGFTGATGSGGLTGAKGLRGVQGLVGLRGLQGTIGTQGTDGTMGQQGYAGNISDNCFDYIYGSTGGLTGTISTNNPNLPLVTHLYVNELDDTGDSISAYINSIKMNDSPIKGYVRMDTVLYAINGIVDSGGNYFDLNVSYLLGSSSIVVTDPLQLCFSRTTQKGDIGATGLQGSIGLQGYQGATGLQGSNGTLGSIGQQGLLGTQGIVGSTGVKGSTGSAGIIGATGLAGATGLKGATGIAGATGIGFLASQNSFNISNSLNGDTLVYRGGEWVNQNSLVECDSVDANIITTSISGPNDFITSTKRGEVVSIYGQVSVPIGSLTGSGRAISIPLPSDAFIRDGVGIWNARWIASPYGGTLSAPTGSNTIYLLLPNSQLPVSSSAYIPLSFKMLGRKRSVLHYGTTIYGLRQIKDTYTGSLVRIRRSSDSSEMDIGFDINGDFDTATFNSFVGGSTGHVTTWYDQSGNARNVARTTPSNQPILTLGAMGNNNRPTVSFSNSSQSYLVNTAQATQFYTQGYSMMYAMVNHISDSAMFCDCGNDSTTNRRFHQLFNTQFITGRDVGGSVSKTGLSPNNDYICVGIHNGTSSSARINGVAGAIGTVSTTTNTSATSFVVGGRYSFDVTGFTGEISELVLFDNATYFNSVTLLEKEAALYFGINPFSPPPVAYWRCDEGSGSSIAAAIGTNNSTSFNGTWVSGIKGSGVNFNTALNQTATFPMTNIPVGNSARSCSFWVKLATLNPVHLVSWGPVGTMFLMHVWTGGSLRVHEWGKDTAADDFETSTGYFTIGAWTHIVVTYDGNKNINAYKNGVSYGSQPIQFDLTTSSGGNVTFNFLVGLTSQFSLDEVAIFNYVLSPSQVSYIYNGGAGRALN